MVEPTKHSTWKNPAAAPSYSIYGKIVREGSYRLVIEYKYLVEFSLTPDRATIAPHHHRLSLDILSRYGETSMDIEISPGVLRVTLPKRKKDIHGLRTLLAYLSTIFSKTASALTTNVSMKSGLYGINGISIPSAQRIF